MKMNYCAFFWSRSVHVRMVEQRDKVGFNQIAHFSLQNEENRNINEPIFLFPKTNYNNSMFINEAFKVSFVSLLLVTAARFSIFLLKSCKSITFLIFHRHFLDIIKQIYIINFVIRHKIYFHIKRHSYMHYYYIIVYPVI